MKGLQNDNVRKIRDAEWPTTKKGVRSFLGLTGYYRDYIPNYSAIAASLTDFIKMWQSNKVKWEESQDRAFNKKDFNIKTYS